MTDMENEIGTALVRLRQVFAKHNLPCPDVLEYSDTTKAYQSLQALRHQTGPMAWGMRSDASPVGELCLAGITLRFDPKYIERPGTGPELDDGVSGRVFPDGAAP